MNMKTASKNTGGMVDVSRTVERTDYDAPMASDYDAPMASDSKESKRPTKKVTSYPSFTVKGKPELANLKTGESVVLKVKVTCTGNKMERDYEEPGDAKVLETSFDVLAIESPKGESQVTKNIIKVTNGQDDPNLEIDDFDNDDDGDTEENDTDKDGE